VSASDSSRYIKTIAVQPELDIAPGFDSFSTPTYRGSTVVFRNLAELRAYGDRSKTYWRYGLHATPTSEALCQQLAQIEGGRHTLLFPSGLGAISLVYFGLLRTGDDARSGNVYGPNRDHGDWMAREFGITVRPYHPSVGAGIASMIQPNTRLIWMESPGSVTMEVPDTEAIVAAAKARGVLTAIDNTWSAGVYYRPFEKGIDISVQALTKYQSGGSDVLMGAVITRDDHLHDRLKRTRMLMGWGVSADDCYLVLRGLASMPVRLAAHDRAAREVAEWLTKRPEVARAASGIARLPRPCRMATGFQRREWSVLDHSAQPLYARAGRCVRRGAEAVRDWLVVGRCAQSGCALSRRHNAAGWHVAAGWMGERRRTGAAVYRSGRHPRPDRRSEAGAGVSAALTSQDAPGRARRVRAPRVLLSVGYWAMRYAAPIPIPPAATGAA
jgi:cystathionine beta-lyase